MPDLEFFKINEKIDIALLCLKSDDEKLFDFDIDISELSISHRLGIYLQILFNEFDVDCEYNRHLNQIKTVNLRWVRPDIVIHKRKEDTNNLLAIEIKTKSDSEKIQKDIDKLIVLTNKGREGQEYLFGYDYGLLLLFEDNDVNPSKFWFENGEVIDSRQ